MISPDEVHVDMLFQNDLRSSNVQRFSHQNLRLSGFQEALQQQVTTLRIIVKFRYYDIE